MGPKVACALVGLMASQATIVQKVDLCAGFAGALESFPREGAQNVMASGTSDSLMARSFPLHSEDMGLQDLFGR